VRDISDELHLLRNVFEQQASVLEQARDAVALVFGPLGEREGRKARDDLNVSLGANSRTLRDIGRVETQAERITSSILSLLDLKQRQADAAQVRYAGYQATLAAASQSRATLTFTIVTVIFTPLSFIAALLTINISELPHEDGEQVLSLSYTLKHVLGIGLPIALVFVVLALSVDRSLDLIKSISVLWDASFWRDVRNRVSPTPGPDRQ
jgi:Mg2+ and Co2+ transporter CorA